jgi:Helix-turn-helix domain
MPQSKGQNETQSPEAGSPEELQSVNPVTVEAEPKSKSEPSSERCFATPLVSGRDMAALVRPMSPTPHGSCSRGRELEVDSRKLGIGTLSTAAEGARCSGPGSTNPSKPLPSGTRERGVVATSSPKGWQNPKRDVSDDAQLLDIRGAARFLGLTPWQVRGLLSAGELKCIRVGRKLYMRRAALMRWAENSEDRYTVA